MAFDKIDQSIQVSGDGNNVANRDVIINNYQQQEFSRLQDSVVVKILTNLLDLVRDEKALYQPLDNTPYTIEDKIKHNEIQKYQTSYDHYMDRHIMISEKMRILTSTEPTATQKLDFYVKGLYSSAVENPINNTADKVIEQIVVEIKNGLQGANLLPEEKVAIPVIVFYVFARCKIFEKPPVNGRELNNEMQLSD